jgi:hypothetical protein
MISTNSTNSTNSTHGTHGTHGTNNSRGDCTCLVFFGGCVKQDNIRGCFAQLSCANGCGDTGIATFTYITHLDREAINDMTQIYLKDFKGNCMKNYTLTQNETIKYMLQHIMYLPPNISFDHYTKYQHSLLSLVMLLGKFAERLQQKKIKKLEDIIVVTTNPVTTAICLLHIAQIKQQYSSK